MVPFDFSPIERFLFEVSVVVLLVVSLLLVLAEIILVKWSHLRRICATGTGAESMDRSSSSRKVAKVGSDRRATGRKQRGTQRRPESPVRRSS
jgi:hypothetical protein